MSLTQNDRSSHKIDQPTIGAGLESSTQPCVILEHTKGQVSRRLYPSKRL